MEAICALKNIYKVLFRFEKDFQDHYSLTINEAMLLCCLKEGKSKTAGEICDYIDLSNSRVSKVITSVENKGLIRRTVNKTDKRQMLFGLTARGKEKTEQMQAADLNIRELYDKLAQCINAV